MAGESESEFEDLDIIHYFVDEAGDPVLFDGKGRVRVGTEGCSKCFIVGKLEVNDPDGLSDKLEALRAELLADPYFKRVPSFQPEWKKTSVMFHAKDDVPEVRQAVFKLLREADLRFYAVVRDKRALVKAVHVRNAQEPGYRYNQDEQYDSLISDLFRHFHGTADIAKVCFARRSKKNRTAALFTALENARAEFQRSFRFPMPGRFEIDCSKPAERAGLQAVDYCLWALQRHYEKGESRYLEYLWPQVGEIHSLDEIAEGRVGVLYGQRRPMAWDTGEQA
jgi:hypothetical protein